MRMSLPPLLDVALKEWAVVCSALASGRQILLLRKGGIEEAIGGFQLEHPQFCLFPTYLHQNAAMLKPEAQAGLTSVADEPHSVVISLAAEVTDILPLSNRGQMEAIEDEHVWTAALVDMRFNYRPRNPLYLLMVRAYRLAADVTIRNTPAYAGCKSWVPLAESITTAGAQAVLDDARYEQRRASIRRRLESAA
jgi:hypothetical protein